MRNFVQPWRLDTAPCPCVLGAPDAWRSDADRDTQAETTSHFGTREIAFFRPYYSWHALSN